MCERASRLCPVVLLIVCGCSPEAQKPTPPAAEASPAPGGAGRSCYRKCQGLPTPRRREPHGIEGIERQRGPETISWVWWASRRRLTVLVAGVAMLILARFR